LGRRRFNAASDVELADRIDNGVINSAVVDLKPFFNRGGKLLMYHGWSDQQVAAANSVDYFTKVTRAAGKAAVNKSIQLYMVPGMGHCQGGPGTDQFDKMAAIEHWVGTGSAPESIVAAHMTAGKADYSLTARSRSGRGRDRRVSNFMCFLKGCREARRSSHRLRRVFVADRQGCSEATRLRQRPALGQLTDSRHRFEDVGERVGVAEPQIAFAVATEGGAVERGDAGFVQQEVGEILRAHTGAGDVWKRVERAGRHPASESRNLVQASDHGVPPAPELRHHRRHGVLRASGAMPARCGRRCTSSNSPSTGDG
jgi:hypothetical protein